MNDIPTHLKCKKYEKKYIENPGKDSYAPAKISLL
jgi:hypothetical protein